MSPTLLWSCDRLWWWWHHQLWRMLICCACALDGFYSRTSRPWRHTYPVLKGYLKGHYRYNLLVKSTKTRSIVDESSIVALILNWWDTNSPNPTLLRDTTSFKLAKRILNVCRRGTILLGLGSWETVCNTVRFRSHFCENTAVVRQ